MGYLYSGDILQNDCNDFKYFLPRLLEISYNAEDQDRQFDCQFWTVLGRANHRNWPGTEQNILQEFGRGYLEKVENEKGTDALISAELNLKEAGIVI